MNPKYAPPVVLIQTYEWNMISSPKDMIDMDNNYPDEVKKFFQLYKYFVESNNCYMDNVVYHNFIQPKREIFKMGDIECLRNNLLANS